MLVVLAAVVSAGVLLFTYARELETEENIPVRDALLKAAKIRLRPRVMVTTAILIGLVPLALALEAVGDMLQPMARCYRWSVDGELCILVPDAGHVCHGEPGGQS